MKTSAIIVAAGSGQRLGSSQPKAFIQLGPYTMLGHCLRTLTAVQTLSEVVVTIPAGKEMAARTEVEQAGLRTPVKLTLGGSERQDSVRIALELTSGESDLVIIHDAARPFASSAIFESCLELAARHGAAIAAVPVADTLKRVDSGRIIATVARQGLYQAQTPQAFRRADLLAAHRRALASGIVATDDASLIEESYGAVAVAESSTLNFKVTTPADFELAKALLLARAQ